MNQDFVFQAENKQALRWGRVLSLLLVIVTAITFALAMVAIPISGSNAPPNSAHHFPYLDTLAQFPRDFIWQGVALVQLVIFLLFIAILQHNAKVENAFAPKVAHAFALVAVTILTLTYYTQLMVVPSSLFRNQTDGIALLIQYNPQGLFIAQEELGYLFMSLSLLFLVPLSGRGSKSYRPIQIVLVVSTLLTTLSFVLITGWFGWDKQDRFEVAIISIDWLTLLVVGTQFFVLFGKEAGSGAQHDPSGVITRRDRG